MKWWDFGKAILSIVSLGLVILVALSEGNPVVTAESYRIDRYASLTKEKEVYLIKDTEVFRIYLSGSEAEILLATASLGKPCYVAEGFPIPREGSWIRKGGIQIEKVNGNLQVGYDSRYKLIP